jgi:hypothetical protein
MTTGFQFNNIDGVNITVDNLYRNLMVREKSSIATVTTIGPNNASRVSFTRSGLVNPMIVLTSTQIAYASAFDNGGGNFTFNIVTAAVIGTSIPFLIFDMTPAGTANFGVEVGDEAGNVTFNAANKYLRVQDTFAAGLTSSVSNTYTAGRAYGVAFNRLGYRFSNQAGNVQVVGCRVNANVVTSGGVIVDSQPGTPPFINESQGQFTVVDVTNY